MLKQLEAGISLNPEDEAALNHLYQKTLLQFELAVSFITTLEAVTAQKMLHARDEINAWCLTQKRSHYERLSARGKNGLSDSLCYLDTLEGLRRIGNHLSTAAYGFKPDGVRARKARVKPVQKDLPALEVPHPPTPENPQPAD